MNHCNRHTHHGMYGMWLLEKVRRLSSDSSGTLFGWKPDYASYKVFAAV